MAIDLKLIDKLLADYKKPEDIISENGLLKQLTKALLERAMQAECGNRASVLIRINGERRNAGHPAVCDTLPKMTWC
jgi:hypothetical protein